MLETTWFLLWGILWAVYFMLDGFDFGVGMLFSRLGKTEAEKQAILRSIAPFWDGNEVWLIAAGGVTFAAFPAAYAVLFSALYSPLMIVLFALIVRAVSLEFRGRIDNPAWRRLFSMGIFSGSLLPALLFGVAFANIFSGIPIDGEGAYHGSLPDLLNPYGLAGGVFFFALFLMHGALWLASRPDLTVSQRAHALSKRLWVPLALLAVLFLVLSAFYTRLWDNYGAHPLLLLVPAITVGALLMERLYLQKRSSRKAFAASAVVIAGSVLFGVLGLFPNLLPSTIDAAYSITIRNAASTPLTLTIMLVVAVIFVPIVMIYQAWVYRFFRGTPHPAPGSGAGTAGEETY